jgi:hypothetical protein
VAKNKKNKKAKKAAKRKKNVPAPDLATSLVKTAKAQAAIGVAPDNLIGRERMAKATRGAQAEYLHEMSPAAASAWEAGRAQAA